MHACLPALAACSDPTYPMPLWRRELVRRGSEFFCGMTLFSCGFYWPKREGLEHVKAGRQMGGVGVPTAKNTTASCMFDVVVVFKVRMQIKTTASFIPKEAWMRCMYNVQKNRLHILLHAIV